MTSSARLDHSKKTPALGECYCPVNEKSDFDTLINVLEKISALVLGAFSFHTNRQRFIPFFFMGFSVGIYSYTQDKKSCHEHDFASSCGHGELEQLTGVRLPRIISLIAGIVIAAEHIEDHPKTGVSFAGFALGHWIGKMGYSYAVGAYNTNRRK